MTNNSNKYCTQLQEFHTIIHNPQLLADSLSLQVGQQYGRPSATFNMNFFSQYSSHPIYMQVISDALDMTYNTWQDYCLETNLTDSQEMKKSYCEIMGKVFKKIGIIGVM